MKHKQHSSGFTIVEVLIIVIVIGILATTTMLIYGNQQMESRDDKRHADMQALIHMIDTYYEKNGNYPLSCNHGDISTTNCTSIASNYSATYGTPVPPQIGGTGMTRDQIKTILPNLDSSFGDPLETTNRPINQHVGDSGATIRKTSYLYLSPDAVNSTLSVSLARSGSTLTCNATPRTTDYYGNSKGNRPHSYIVGYYSEVDKTWKLFSGPRLDSVNDLGWNSSNTTACELSVL